MFWVIRFLLQNDDYNARRLGCDNQHQTIDSLKRRLQAEASYATPVQWNSEPA